MTNICVSKLATIGSDHGLSPGRRQAIIWTNAGILLIGPLGTHFGGILIEIHTFSLKKMRLERSSAKRHIVRNVLIWWYIYLLLFGLYFLFLAPSNDYPTNTTMTISNHRPLDCWFNNLFILTTMEHQSPQLVALCEGGPLVTDRFHWKGQ